MNVLSSETSRTQFLSTISELTFGEIFHQLGLKIIYEKKYYNRQTPDWTIINGSEHAICDVYRLGKSNKDQKRSDFENTLIEKVKLLNFSYIIKIIFIDEYFDTYKYSIDYVVEELEQWLNHSTKKVDEELLVSELFIFKIFHITDNEGHVQCIGNNNSIDYKPQKLIQYKHLKNLNEISKKVNKYDSIILTSDLPYFIAIDIDFISGFNFDDFTNYFRGKRTTFVDFGKQITGNPEIDQLGKEWSELGEFYSNEQLSGLILRYNNETKLLTNPMKSQIIYKHTKLLKKLETIQRL